MKDYNLLIKYVQRSLSDDLLNSKWKQQKNYHRLSGHCYIAAESLWHLIGASKSGYFPKVISKDDWTHWYLENGRGQKLDPTKEQFLNEQIPYEKGRKCGFLTKFPSKRAKIVIDRVNKIL